MITMNVDIMLLTVAELNEEKKCTYTQKIKLTLQNNMNLKFSLTKEYFQVLSLTIIIFYTFFTHTNKSDMILCTLHREWTISRKRESHGKIFHVLSPAAKLKSR